MLPKAHSLRQTNINAFVNYTQGSLSANMEHCPSDSFYNAETLMPKQFSFDVSKDYANLDGPVWSTSIEVFYSLLQLERMILTINNTQ